MTENTRHDFDAGGPETFDSAHEEYARLRAQCPVAHSTDLGGFWGLMRYDDVKRAASDAETFITSKQNVVPKIAFTGRRPPLHLDPPDHTPYRRALNMVFTKERAEALVPFTRNSARELLAPMLAKGGGDICAEFASFLPVYVFGEWARMPAQWLHTLHEAGRAFILAVHNFDQESMKATSLRLYEIARDFIALRQREPGDPNDDPVSALLAARHQGEPLPPELVVGCVRQVLVVGIVAPTVMMGSISVHLSRDPELQDRLRTHSELLPDAIEEFLRLYTPYRGFARTATHDVTFGDVTIRTDEAIALVYASANRDESVFPQGDEFIMCRPNIGEHLAFGRGPHNCPGLHIGRMELRVALEELLASTKQFSVVGEIGMTRWPEIGALTVPLQFE